MTDEQINTEGQEQAIPNQDATDPNHAEKMLQRAAHDAIIAAGGSPDLLMPHITPQLGWRRDGDEIIVFSKTGDGPSACQELVAEMKANPAFTAAFPAAVKPQQPAPDQPIPAKQGSGASSSQMVAPATIDASSPLAIGHALKDIARGHVRVRFND